MSERPVFEGSATIEEADFLEAHDWAARREMPLLRVLRPLGVVSWIVAFAIAAIGIRTTGRPFEFALLPFVLGLVFVLLPGRVAKVPARLFGALAPADRVVSFRLDDDGVQLRSTKGDLELPWARVRAAHGATRGLLLVHERSVVPLPWRGFAAGVRGSVEALVGARVKATPAPRLWPALVLSLVLWAALLAASYALYALLVVG